MVCQCSFYKFFTYLILDDLKFIDGVTEFSVG